MPNRNYLDTERKAGDNRMNNELYHYGVIGMKWGVHKGRYAESYAKGVAKIKKLESKSAKAQERYNSVGSAKARMKVANLRRRADRLQYLSARRFPTLNRQGKFRRATRLKAKASRIEARQARIKYSMQKNAIKAEKFYKKMQQVYKDVPVSKLNKSDVNFGKQYAKQIAEREKAREISRGATF